MGTAAEFEEKEFETLANASLVIDQVRFGGGVRIFSPGQVAEKQLGFDLATRIDPRGKLYRRLFGAVPGAPGIDTTTQASLGLQASASTHLLNVFLQYKRPESFGPRHRSDLFAPGQEHLAFWIREKGDTDAERFAQVDKLTKLESDLSTSALVRYACPSTWRKQELYQRFSDGTLLATSTFVRPSQLAAPAAPGFHARWRFDPRVPSRGIPNPGGPEQEVMSGSNFAEAVDSAIAQPTAALLGEAFSLASERTRPLQSELDELRQRRPKIERDEYETEQQAMQSELRQLAPHEEEVVRAAVDVALIARDLRLNWFIAVQV